MQIAEGYRGKVGEHTAAPTVLKQRLMVPFLGGSINEGSLSVSCAEIGSAQRDQVDAIVNWAYNTSYTDGSSFIDIVHDELDPLPTTHTATVTGRVGQSEEVVLGVLRFASEGKLDIFELFEMEDGYVWPHEEDSSLPRKAGEIGKFSLHPGIEDKNLAHELLGRLYEFGIDLMRKDGVEVPYFILAPHVKKFVVETGIIPVSKVDGVRPSRSPSSQSLRHIFSRYWQPDKDPRRQPAVYVAPWSLRPLGHMNGRGA